MLHKMIGGSSAFGQAARSVLGVARHPDQVDQRIVGRIKGNLSKPPRPRIFDIQSITFDIGADTKISTSKVELHDEDELEEDFDFLAALQGRKKKQKDPATEDRRPINEAINFLRAELTIEEGLPVKEVLRLAREAGISRSTLYRAKGELGIIPQKRGDGYWWGLPPEGEPNGQV